MRRFSLTHGKMRNVEHDRRVAAVALTPDGKALISATDFTGEVKLTELASGETREIHRIGGATTTGVTAFNPSGAYAVIAMGETITVALATGKVQTYRTADGFSASFSPDGSKIAVGSRGDVYLLDFIR